jgi:cysteine desulfurase
MLAPLMLAYLDNAASTAPLPEVVEAVARAMRDHVGNPSSLHALGAAAARVLATARADVAALIHAEPDDVVFTGSGTEANALGLLGAARAGRGQHLVVSAIEHAAVFDSARRLTDEGWRTSVVAPEANGCLAPAAVLAALETETTVVAVMLVNNEIGSLQPIAEIGRALRATSRKVHLHVDAVQAAGLLPVDVRGLGADSLAISAHKLHGPKGVGALWLGKGRRLQPLHGGGGQERDLRSGTENLPACVGFGVAAAAVRADAGAAARVAALRDDLEARIEAGVARATRAIPAGTPRAPHIASLLLPGLPAEPVLHALEARGVVASEGAACSTRKREQSRVLRALGVPTTTGALRFSLSRLTTGEEVVQAAQALGEAIAEVARAVDRGR